MSSDYARWLENEIAMVLTFDQPERDPRGDEAMTEADYRCPDCGRETCTGEDCYWPDEAGIPRPGPASDGDEGWFPDGDPRDDGFIGGYRPGVEGD